MIKLVILDLDNTLYDENLYIKGVLKKFEKVLDFPVGVVCESIEHISRGDSEDILKDCLLYANKYSVKNHDLLFRLYKSSRFHLSLYPGVNEYLSQLKQHNCFVAILTNGVVAVQKNKVKNLKVDLKVDKVFYARENELGYEKPMKECFIHVVDFFGCELDEAIMIGDHYKNDYMGAINAGIHAIWLNGVKSNTSLSRLSDSLDFILGDI